VSSTGRPFSLLFNFRYSAGKYVTFRSKGKFLIKKSTLLICPTVGKTDGCDLKRCSIKILDQ
jgi:hypothetical protein